MTNNNYRGIKGVKMIWHGTNSDPELVYKGVRANYWTIEDWLFDNFCDDLHSNDMYDLYKGFTESDKDDCFNWRLQKNSYLMDDIFGLVKEHNIL